MAVVSNSQFSRRMLFGFSLTLFALTGVAAKAADQVTFVSQGGAYQKAQTVAILDPAARKLGITVNQDSAPDAWPVIKTQVASGKPTWDVVDTPTGYCLRGGEQGLIEKLDFSKIPNAAAMPANFEATIRSLTNSIRASLPIAKRNSQAAPHRAAGPISGTSRNSRAVVRCATIRSRRSKLP
jgi:spermidine/putrescine-binding protein